MPVLVTGAQTALGRAVVRTLLGQGGQVRAYVDEAQAPEGLVAQLRGHGCKVARGTLDDEGLLELALAQVHTVAHLATGFLDDPTTLLDDLAGVVAAAIGAGCRRFIWLSHLGAGEPGAGDAVLAASAEGEALLAESPFESIVIRRDLTYGPDDPFTAALGAGVPEALESVRRAPLYVDDLAAAVVAADRHRRDTSAPQIVVELAGPQVLGIGELAARLSAGQGRLRPLGGAGALPAHTTRLLGVDREPGPATLGREGTPLDVALRRMALSGAGTSATR
jgi:uncharacterized protein YbjT (DUF2867 family)